MFLRTRRPVYEGKTKTLYESSEPGTLIQYFRDDVTVSAPARRKGHVPGKGVFNNRISAHLMTRLEAMGIPTHFMRSLSMREQMIRQLEMIPLQVVIRNSAAGGFCNRFGVKEGTVLPRPVTEFRLKNDELGDPMVSEDHIMAFNWAGPMELDEMVSMSWRINDYLSGLFAGVGLRLVDLKLEFGRLWGEYDDLYIMLADEISPDSCRLWDIETGEKFDKDRFRLEMDNIPEAYQTVAERLGLLPKGAMLIEDGAVNERLAESLGAIENDIANERRLRAVPKTPPPKGRK